MFKIEYKIIYENCLSSDVYYEYSSDIPDYFDTVGTAYGDILITVNNSHYGAIYDIPAEDDYGDTVLDVWFCNLLDACSALRLGREYRIAEIESLDAFLYFEKNENDRLTVTSLTGGKTEWKETVSCEEFAVEVISAAEKFIGGLCAFNERMAHSKVVSSIKNKLDKLKKERIQ